MEEKLSKDLIAAQKSGDSFRVETLRLVIAQIKNKSIEKRGAGKTEPLTDAEVIEVMQREAKKRREAADMFRNGNRADLAQKEDKETAIIAEYLPQQMSREEILKTVQKIAEKEGGDFKVVMKVAMAELKGKADGKLVSEVVKEVTG